jgi:hypothetical protein
MNNKNLALLVALLLVLLLFVSGCSPKAKTLDGVYYSDVKQNGNSFMFLKFFPDGTVSFVAIGLGEGVLDTPENVYNNTAGEWLTESPPSPAMAGTYSLQDGELQIFFPAGSSTPKQTGTYTQKLIVLTDENNLVHNYLPLNVP